MMFSAQEYVRCGARAFCAIWGTCLRSFFSIRGMSGPQGRALLIVMAGTSALQRTTGMPTRAPGMGKFAGVLDAHAAVRMASARCMGRHSPPVGGAPNDTAL